MEYLALDFEYASSTDRGSICQVGLVKYSNGEVTTLMDCYVDPQVRFCPNCVSVHGITAEKVVGSPTFEDIYEELCSLIVGQVIFNQNGADKSIFESACAKWGLSIPEADWVNATTVAKRAWPGLDNYRLGSLCAMLDIDLKYHNAASDARATALIIEAAKENIGFDTIKEIKEITKRVRKPRNYDDEQKICGDLLVAPDLDSVEDKENPFFGKKVVVSGTYEAWPDRKELVLLLKSLGADIDSAVSKKTNFLCAGAGVGPSKMEKAEKNGVAILNESEIKERLGI